MMLLRRNLGTLLKLLILFYCLHMFLMNFGEEAVFTVVHLVNKISLSHTSSLSLFENLYDYASDCSFLKVFDCTYFVIYPCEKRNKLSPHSVICVFLRDDEGQKGYCYFDLISHKLYVFHHVFFLEHIHFISIPTYQSHNVSKFEFVHIDPFLDDTNSFLTDFGTLVLFDCHDPSSPPRNTLALFKIVNPPPHTSQCPRKYTQLPDFVYSSYFDSFTFFLAKNLDYSIVLP